MNLLIFFLRYMLQVKCRRGEQREATYDGKAHVNWKDGKQNGFKGDGVFMQDTAGEVEAEMEKWVEEAEIKSREAQV